MAGAMCYVDLFAGDLQGLRAKIPYLLEMGITYLHLMPVFQVPAGDSDGGYAVSSYREIHPPLGSMNDLTELAAELRCHGISLVVDFVFSHSSDEHEWAKRALSGEEEFQEYCRTFPDRELPDAYEASMVEVFPDERPGAFNYRTQLKKWVWTTFHSYQWDLNYENLAVFSRMLEEMLFLANQGIELLRLDAVAFLWKPIGTPSQNLPEAHWIIQAFNTLGSIAGSAMVFKSEAIVHPDEVRKHIGMLNNTAYSEDVAKAGDSGWLHWPVYDWQRSELRRDRASVVGRIHQGLLRLVQLRNQNPAFSRTETEIADTENQQVFAYFRTHQSQSVFVLANFSEQQQSVDARHLRLLGLRRTMVDMVAGRAVTATQELILEPYQLMALARSM